jgi:hypothetical protein
VRFLRRNAKETVDPADEDAAEVTSAVEQNSGTARTHTPGKGRPTPKRRDAERRRRGPVPPPPRTQREAMRRSRGNKDERRKTATERRERMMAGDDRYLMPRDRGPVRAYVRDLVDSRRNLMGFFMPLAIVVFLALLVPSVRIQQYATLFCTVMLALMIVEGAVLGMIVTRRVRTRFPDATDRGLSLGWYAFVRASQVRRLRVPRPRVRVGERPA